MPRELRDAVVLITGAAGGFGQCLVRQLVRAGSRLILTDRDAPALRQATAAALKAGGLDVQSDTILGQIAADLSTADGCADLVAQLDGLPPIDILINNAGLGLSGRFVDVPPDAIETLLAVNLLAPVRLTRALLPGMIARGGGHIVNLASVAGLVGTPLLVPYSTSKFGLRGFSEALGREVRQQGIDVTAVFPYFARTPILRSPHFGAGPAPALNDRDIGDPEMVVAAMIQGIRRRDRVVVPGPVAGRIAWLQRWAPRLIDRQIARQTR